MPDLIKDAENAEPRFSKAKKGKESSGSLISTEGIAAYSLQGRKQAMTEAQAFAKGYAETSAAAASAIADQIAKIRKEVYGIDADLDLDAIEREGAESVEDFTEGLKNTFAQYFSV